MDGGVWGGCFWLLPVVKYLCAFSYMFVEGIFETAWSQRYTCGSGCSQFVLKMNVETLKRWVGCYGKNLSHQPYTINMRSDEDDDEKTGCIEQKTGKRECVAKSCSQNEAHNKVYVFFSSILAILTHRQTSIFIWKSRKVCTYFGGRRGRGEGCAYI